MPVDKPGMPMGESSEHPMPRSDRAASPAGEGAVRDGMADRPTASSWPRGSGARLLIVAFLFAIVASGGIAALGGVSLACYGGTVGVFAVTHLLGAIFQRVPRGNELALFRSGIVAFCRTLCPLVVFGAAAYNGSLEVTIPWVLAVLVLQFVPMGASVWAEVRGAVDS